VERALTYTVLVRVTSSNGLDDDLSVLAGIRLDRRLYDDMPASSLT